MSAETVHPVGNPMNPIPSHTDQYSQFGLALVEIATSI